MALFCSAVVVLSVWRNQCDLIFAILVDTEEESGDTSRLLQKLLQFVLEKIGKEIGEIIIKCVESHPLTIVTGILMLKENSSLFNGYQT